MLDRIELRRQEQGDAGTHVVAEVGRSGDARIDVTIQGIRTTHAVDAARFARVTAPLDRASPRPFPTHAEGGAAVGYEIIISAGMTQSVFRWVGSTPESWEPIADVAAELLAVARELRDRG